MKRSQINPLPEYFDRYIKLVADVELSQAFADSIEQLKAIDRERLTKLGDKRYAPDKWTVKDIIQHLVDVERVLSYRSLLFARKDPSVPQGFDQDLMAANANADNRTIDGLIEELSIIRTSTKALFDSFDDETLQRRGVNWKYEMTVLAMGFSIIGHQIHHLRIIEERYHPLLT